MSDAAAAVENLPEAHEGEAGVFAVIPNTDCPHLEKVSDADQHSSFCYAR